MSGIGNTVSRDMIFRAVKGVVGGTLGRTLSECLYWSQFAQHFDGDKPVVWKTGAELGNALGCHPRTANTHLKKLEMMGFWQIEYKPRPGRPSKVTWLRYKSASAKMLGLARSLRDEQAKPRRKQKRTVSGPGTPPLTNTDAHVQQSQIATSKHCKTSLPTSEKQKGSFFLAKEEVLKLGKKETFQKFQKAYQEDEGVKAPKFAEASPREEKLVAVVQKALVSRQVQSWDCSSWHTWKHTKEICEKLAKHGLATPDQWAGFIDSLLENWSWLRSCMAYRYASHGTNLHRPSPMALNHEFETLFSAVSKKYAPTEANVSHGNLDKSFDSFDEEL